jgi:16S rRNA (cytidine1402-2'-O)-methyltransferase
MANNKKALGTLFLIPSSLDQEGIYDFMVEEQRHKINDLQYFIVENEKSARRTVKKLNLLRSVQELILTPHTKDTPLATLQLLIKPILDGHNVGLLSDAGVPCVADPGSKIVKLAHQNNIKVVPLVGPSSIILSLMASGFNGQKFKFNGYLPIKKDEKTLYMQEMQKNILKGDETQIFIETPYRNDQLLSDLIEILDPGISICIAVNLTTNEEMIISKTIEQWKKSSLPDLSKKLCIFLLN